MRLIPTAQGSGEWIDQRSLLHHSASSPSRWGLEMVPAARRNGELIADLPPKRPALREAKVVGVAGLAVTDQARLLSHLPDVLAMPHPARLREQQGALVD